MLDHIEEERGRKGLSKEELSRELNITSRTYWNYLSTGMLPSDKLIYLCNGCRHYTPLPDKPTKPRRRWKGRKVHDTGTA